MKKKIKILRLIMSATETSAAYNEFSLPKKEEHEITICSLLHASITPPDRIVLIEGGGSIKKYLQIIVNEIRNNKYDVAHLHSPHVGLIYLLVKSIYAKSCPPALMTIGSSFSNYKLLYRLLFLPLFLFLERIVFCSKGSYHSFPTFYKRLARKKFSIINNGVNIARIDKTLQEQNMEEYEHNLNGSFDVVSVGRIIKSKNVFTLLEAFNQCDATKTRLVFVGEGDLSDELKQKSREVSNHKTVDYKGLIPRERVYQTLSESHVFISTSLVEGMPVAVLEAMACRLPVILSDIPPHAELAEGLDFIRLVQPFDIEGFSVEIGKYYNMAEKDRVVLGNRCREHVEKNFSLESVLNKYEELFKELIKEAKIRSND